MDVFDEIGASRPFPLLSTMRRTSPIYMEITEI